MRKALVVVCVSIRMLTGSLVTLTDQEIAQLGKTIWLSECNGTLQGLLTWNNGEDFPSLGIGHFIWYPTKSSHKRFAQTFPDLISFMQSRGVAVPAWLISQAAVGCPWPDKQSFIAARSSERMQELLTLLSTTVDTQARFIVARFETELSAIISSLPTSKQPEIKQIVTTLARSYKGMFALIDYVHFKGAGTNPSESYQGHRWGLQSVLLAMNGASDNLLAEFVKAAKATLEKRVALAPNKEQEQKWLKGWQARVERYLSC